MFLLTLFLTLISIYLFFGGNVIHWNIMPLLSMKRKTINQGRICSSVTSVYLKARWAFPHGSLVKNPPGNAGDAVWSLSWEDPLEKEKVIHSSTITWKIPWTEEPGRLQSMGSQRVRHDWATSLSPFFLLSKVSSSQTWLIIFPFFSWTLSSWIVNHAF